MTIIKSALLAVIVLASCATYGDRYPMPALSQHRVNANFSAAYKGFEQRWRSFSKNRQFVTYASNLDDKEILEQFKQMQAGIKKDKIKFSIQELVYKLTLQRVYLVGKPEQYLTLHKLAKLYLAEK